MKTLKTWVLEIFSILLLLPALAGAAPALLNYQGRLIDANGNPLSGTKSITFSIYAAATGGSAIWTEPQSLALDNGIFSASLGSVVNLPPSVFSSDTRYLGVTVLGDAEMSPRAQLLSVPYAIYASSAASVGISGQSVVISTFVTISGDAGEASSRLVISTGGITVFRVNGSGEVYANKYIGDGSLLTGISAAAIPDGSVSSLKLADGAIVNVDVAAGAAIDAAKIGGGAVTNTEFSYLSGVTSAIQTQLAGKLSNTTGVPASLINLSTVSAVLDSVIASTAPLSNSANWNTAFGWGNHATGGYATAANLNSVIASTAPLANSSNWDTAFGWGNHATGGYATAANLNAVILSTAPLANSANWDTAFGWGNHATGGYATAAALNASNLTSGVIPDLRLSGTYSSALTFGSASGGPITFSTNVVINASQFIVGNYAATPATNAGAGAVYYNTVDGLLYVSNGSSWSSLASGGASPWTAGAGAVTLVSAANKVGIAKTPEEKLDVAGNIKADYGIIAATATFSGNVRAGTFINASSAALTGNFGVGGVITAGSSNIQITDAAGNLDATKLTGNLPAISGSALSGIITSTSVLQAQINSIAVDTGTLTTGLAGKAGTGANAFSGAISATNLSGTNTGDDAANTNYASDYRLGNFVAGTNYLAPTGIGSGLSGIITSTSVLQAQINSIAVDTGTLTTGLAGKAGTGANAFSGAISATNLSGTNTGDDAANTNYASDYRLGNFVAGTNYLAPTGIGSGLSGIITSTEVIMASFGAVQATISTAVYTNATPYEDPVWMGSLALSKIIGVAASTDTIELARITGVAASTDTVAMSRLIGALSSTTSISAALVDLSTVTALVGAVQATISTAVYTNATPYEDPVWMGSLALSKIIGVAASTDTIELARITGVAASTDTVAMSRLIGALSSTTTVPTALVDLATVAALGANTFTGNQTINGNISASTATFSGAVILTASGLISVDGSFPLAVDRAFMKVQSSDADDMLLAGVPLIEAGTAGQVVVIEGTATKTVTFPTGGNIKLSGANVTLGANDIISLLYDGNNWVELYQSVNAD